MVYSSQHPQSAGPAICSGCMKALDERDDHFRWGDCVVCRACHDRLSAASVQSRCGNCSRSMGRLEHEYHWEGKTVCAKCLDLLKAKAAAAEHHPYICDNCGRVLDRREKPYELHGQIICLHCRALKPATSARSVKTKAQTKTGHQEPAWFTTVSIVVLELLGLALFLFMLALIKTMHSRN